MESRSKSVNESEVLDVKPSRTLSPMLPIPFGHTNTYVPPNASPFTCVTPLGSFATESAYPPGFCSLLPSFYVPQDLNQKPVEPTFVNDENGLSHSVKRYDVDASVQNASTSPFFLTPPAFVSSGEEDAEVSGASSQHGRIVKQSPNYSGVTEGRSKKRVRSRPPKVAHGDLGLLPSSMHHPRESVEVVLMTFDALRRRLMQIDQAKKLRADLKAGTIMMTNDLRANMEKRIGHVPGVEVGDIFYFRIEMCLVGLHSQSIAGIDYMTARSGGQNEPVAVGIVSAGVYDNEEDNVDNLIYTGQGSSSNDDQKLERGNLALERSMRRGNLIRVIRSAKDPNVLNGKNYVYDGLYKINSSWVEKGKSGFNNFKYKLLREPGQPDGIAVWKNTERWKENPSSRGFVVILLDISSGIENRPVCLVNEVDGEKGPNYFTYSTTVSYSRVITSTRSLQSCICINACHQGDSNCSCLHQNGGNFPYTSTGILISRKPLVYECSASCQCSITCQNRVTQKGVRLRFEVFRTKDRGWGIRCWDAIRAGTFICEYIGEIFDNIQSLDYEEENDYLFQPMYFDHSFKWNYVPELLGEPGDVDPTETSKTLSFVINAKNMGNISRFMNHSCSPNVFWQPVLYDHSDDRYPNIMFFAIKHIPPMTELTYDYGPRPAEMEDHLNFHRHTKCLCGSANCRGFFG